MTMIWGDRWAPLTTATAVVYVAKWGSDASTGLHPGRAKLTIGAALTVGAALVSGGASKALIAVLDGDTYTENLVVTDNLVVYGPGAALVGTVTLHPGAEAHVDRHYAAVSTSDLVVAETNAGATSHYSAHVLDGRGIGGALTDTTLVRNSTSGRVLMVRVGIGFVPQSGFGVRDATAGGGFGYVHFSFHDLYLAGNNARGVRTNNATTNLIGYIDHVLEIGSPTGTVAFDLRDAGSIVKIVAVEVIADEVWNITAGALHIVCPKLTGTRTGAATVVIDGAFASLTGLPTTLAGYGITDAYTQTQINTALALKANLSGATFTGAVITGTDPGGSELLRLTGVLRAEGISYATTQTYYVNGVQRLQMPTAGGVIVGSSDPGGSELLRVGGGVRQNEAAALLHAQTALANGAAAAAGTLLNAPAAGNPTKWIPIDDAGTTRYVPAW